MSSENEPILVAAPTSIGHNTKEYRLLSPPRVYIEDAWDAWAGVRVDGVLVQVSSLVY